MGEDWYIVVNEERYLLVEENIEVSLIGYVVLDGSLENSNTFGIVVLNICESPLVDGSFLFMSEFGEKVPLVE